MLLIPTPTQKEQVQILRKSQKVGLLINIDGEVGRLCSMGLGKIMVIFSVGWYRRKNV